jgi:hypothetical protein
MAPPRSLALLEALEREFTARRWSDVRSLYHDEALLRTVAAGHRVLDPDELMEVFAHLDDTVYLIGSERRVIPIDDNAAMVIASLRHESSMGVAHDQVCWLLTFKDELVFRSSDYVSEAAARSAYGENGIGLGIHEHS